MNVLSFFDGMSCGRIALERAGIRVDNYFAAEIDKYAIKVSKYNYPDIIQLGDVCNIKANQLPKIDLFMGGSPCQGFSFAGRQLNFNDPRSKLFFEYNRVLKEILLLNPDVKFLLENVVMKKEYQNVISSYLGVQPIMINSALVSAQNRKRLYWTNISGIQQPNDKGIILENILQEDIFDRFSVTKNTNPSGRGMNGVIHLISNKAPCLTTNKGEGVKIGVLEKKSLTLCAGYANNPNLNDYLVKRIKQMVPVLVGRINSSQDGKIVSPFGKSYCHTAGNGNVPKVAIEQRSRGNNKGGFHYNKSPTLTSNSWQENNKLTNGLYYRKLTPIECERLQTIPDNYTQCVSNSQRYKMLGNGWTIDVIVGFFKKLSNEPQKRSKQLELF